MAATVLAVAVDGVLAIRWDDPKVVDDRAARVAVAADVRGLRPGERGGPDATVVRPDATDTAPADPAEGATTGSTATSRASSQATSTTVAGRRTPSIQPGALRAPTPGRYPIRVVSGGQAVEGELVIDDQQWQRRSLGSDGGTAQQLTWTADGAILAASGQPGDDGACRWEGPAVAVPSDLRDGRRWSSRTICRSEIGGRPVRVVRRESARVSKRARTQLAGRTVDTWVIEREIALTIEAETFMTTSVSISTELFVPDLGLAVYHTSRTDVPLPDGTTRSVYASEEVLDLPR